MKVLQGQALLRGLTAAELQSNNAVYRARELVFETDTTKFKFGDGVTAWNDLPYAGHTVEEIETLLEDYVSKEELDTLVSDDIVRVGEDGLIDKSLIPEFKIDILDSGYFNTDDELMYTDSDFTTPVEGDVTHIYIGLNDSNVYLYSGVKFVEVSKQITLGEVEGTAYDGGKGKEVSDKVDALEELISDGGDLDLTAIKEALEKAIEDLEKLTSTVTDVSDKLDTTAETLDTTTETLNTVSDKLDTTTDTLSDVSDKLDTYPEVDDIVLHSVPIEIDFGYDDDEEE